VNRHQTKGVKKMTNEKSHPSESTTADASAGNATATAKKSSLPELRAALADAQTAAASAQGRCDTLDNQRAAVVRQGINPLAQHDAARADAGRQLDVALAAVDDATARLRAAEAAETEGTRRARYDAVQAAIEPLVTEAQKVQREITSRGTRMIDRLRSLNDQIIAVNLDLPAGHDPLPTLDSDPRLCAGELQETRGLFVATRKVLWSAVEYWMRIPPPPAAVTKSSPPQPRELHPIRDAAGESMQPKFFSLPINGQPTPDESSFQPKVFRGARPAV
jgi:hypothetical protein